MTTNVFDEVKRFMATDSRWSVRQGKFIVYLDDTGCEKIEINRGHAFMFAGNGGRIQQWKNWIRSNPTDDSGQPQEEGVCFCIVDMSTGKVKRSVKQKLIPVGGFFAGTGTTFAVPCWTANQDAHRSVETAKTQDDCSGGEVKFYDFAGGKHNLNYPSGNVTIQMVDAAILKRGLVMITNENSAQILPFAKAAANSPEVAEIHAKIAAGELSASAPAEGMYEAWTAEEKAGLKDTLADIFSWNKKEA